jgi:hypothetical protein
MGHFIRAFVCLMGVCICSPLFLPNTCSAQIAPLYKLRTAGDFLDVCGRGDQELSKEQLATVKNAPPSQAMEKLREAGADRLTEVVMCAAFVSGLEQGWKAGHEHGVIAAQFPAGWPEDEQKALSGLPLKQLEATNAAMSVDVPCIPSYVTVGQEKDIVVRFIQNQEKQGNVLITDAPTYRVVYFAFQEAFQCPAKASKPPSVVK